MFTIGYYLAAHQACLIYSNLPFCKTKAANIVQYKLQ